MSKPKSLRKEKWKNIPLNHSNVDEYLTDLKNGTKAPHIMQGVAFNKEDGFQMNLLKQALLTHGSFSGFIKHLLYAHFAMQQQMNMNQPPVYQPNEQILSNWTPLEQSDINVQVEETIQPVSTVPEKKEEILKTIKPIKPLFKPEAEVLQKEAEKPVVQKENKVKPSTNKGTVKNRRKIDSSFITPID